MPLAQVEVAVEEALNPPVKIKLPVTVDEACEINPLPTVSMPVVEALASVVLPETFKVPVAVILATLEMFPDK